MRELIAAVADDVLSSDDPAMDFFWPAEDAAAVVRSRFDRTNWQARVVAYRPVEVTADENDLVVVFRYGGLPELFAVRFCLALMPEGATRPARCASPWMSGRRKLTGFSTRS